MSFDDDRERPLTRCYQSLHQNVQEYRLNLAEEQNQLKGKILLRHFQASVMWSHHPNRNVEAPNTAKNCDSNEWNEVQDDIIKCFDVLNRNHVQDEKNCDVSDRHLKDQESQEVELLPEITKVKSSIYAQTHFEVT